MDIQKSLPWDTGMEHEFLCSVTDKEGHSLFDINTHLGQPGAGEIARHVVAAVNDNALRAEIIDVWVGASDPDKFYPNIFDNESAARDDYNSKTGFTGAPGELNISKMQGVLMPNGHVRIVDIRETPLLHTADDIIRVRAHEKLTDGEKRVLGLVGGE